MTIYTGRQVGRYILISVYSNLIPIVTRASVGAYSVNRRVSSDYFSTVIGNNTRGRFSVIPWIRNNSNIAILHRWSGQWNGWKDFYLPYHVMWKQKVSPIIKNVFLNSVVMGQILGLQGTEKNCFIALQY